MARYSIVEDSTDHIVNIVAWDGESEFKLPNGCTIRPWQQGDEIWQEPEPLPDLSASQFHYMLALLGLHNVINGIIEYLEDQSSPLFPVVYGHMAGQTFSLEKTLDIVSQLRPLADSLYPQVDTADETITNAWNLAAQWNR